MALVTFKAEEIAAEIRRRMSTILVENGYETGIGKTVWRGRRKIPADEEVPVSVILEGDDTPGSVQPNKRVAQIKQMYVLDGFDACDPNNPNDKAHMMLRDMKKAMFRDGGTFGGMVRDVAYVGRDIGPRPDGGGFVQARIVIEVEFVEDFFNA